MRMWSYQAAELLLQVPVSRNLFDFLLALFDGSRSVCPRYTMLASQRASTGLVHAHATWEKLMGHVRLPCRIPAVSVYHVRWEEGIVSKEE